MCASQNLENNRKQKKNYNTKFAFGVQIAGIGQPERTYLKKDGIFLPQNTKIPCEGNFLVEFSDNMRNIR